MADVEEFQPADDSLVTWDGTILEIFQSQASYRYHARGIEEMHINDGRIARGVLVKNRFGSDGAFNFDKDRLADVRAFCDRVMTVAREYS